MQGPQLLFQWNCLNFECQGIGPQGKQWLVGQHGGVVEQYVDAAYTSGLPFGRIIHGKGTGALRKAVREHVEMHPLILKVEMARPNEGGDGVTVIHMASMT